jgi:hypothetical protein
MGIPFRELILTNRVETQPFCSRFGGKVVSQARWKAARPIRSAETRTLYMEISCFIYKKGSLWRARQERFCNQFEVEACVPAVARPLAAQPDPFIAFDMVQ